MGLPPPVCGRLVQAAVIRALIFGTECRQVSARARTLRRWQVFLNGICRGICHQRIKNMREDQVTQRDLTKKAGLWNIKTYVWLGQLRYLGHLARLPDNRIEKHILFGWLPDETMNKACRGASNSRQYLWKLLNSFRLFVQYSLDTWRNDWIHLAQQEDGAVWASLLKKWARWLEKQRDSDTWLARHADAARAGRKQAAATRAYDKLGAHMQPDGRYKWP